VAVRKFEDSQANSTNNLVRSRAMDSAELRERADHYRMIAIQVTDAHTKEGLLELAEHYEARAREMEQGGAESNDQ
jgi:putative protein kinase ArgK-like GTPase of G3E family